ncbi:CHASE2 domain-containing protein [Pseudomonas sp. PSKL.D1]|uniref:CHASE2 domain-containing protein n=1 Tax=Pseudomonas sp. PSKL.D1 TaxID=3029060 RepID=UPI0023814E56|nr:CHASE2 domain-containing protein [Pseudomonas sp. PSKL.D1]WDY58127.1 CHASE2 domain-containing protein [Pseudomonas sp. PSKL.D1]
MLKHFHLSFRQALFGLAAVLIALLDPIGLASSTDDASSRWLNRLLATSYADTGQRQVVVVLIDDDYLQRNHTYWPLPYAEQSKLFKRLLAYKPGAVFVDLLYSHDHSRVFPGQPSGMESQLLANVFERYRQQNIPLILANSGLERGKDGAVNTLPSLLHVSSPTLVSWSGFGNQYPLAAPTSLGVLETPALSLYREYCRRNACKSLPANAEAAADLAPMTVQWGAHRSPRQALVSDVSECKVPGLLDQLLQAVFWRLGNNAQANCAYSLTLSARDLEVTASQDQALIRELLQDKLVLVGAQIAGTGDITVSPLHGKTPGVYLHAMALDNLINWGMGYYRSTPSLIGSVDVLDFIELALLALITLLKGPLEAPVVSASVRGERSRLHLEPLSAWVIVILLLAGVSATLWFNNFTPANVLGLLLLSLTLFSTRIEALLGGSRHGQSELSTQGAKR